MKISTPGFPIILLFGVLFTMIYIITYIIFGNSEISNTIVIISTFLYISLIFLVYLKVHRTIKKIKAVKNWESNTRKMAVSDTNFSKKERFASPV